VGTKSVVFYQTRLTKDGWEEYTMDAIIETSHKSPMGTLYKVRFGSNNAQIMDKDSIERFTKCVVDLRGIPEGYSI
jgi:hypothetical protein